MYRIYGYVKECKTIPITYPPQYQPQQPGIESIMIPRPISENPCYIGSSKLRNKVAIITGGDSGIGRAVAIAFAKEGANVVIVYLNEHGDALETKYRVEQLGRKCLTIAGDIGDECFCQYIVQKTMEVFGHIEILVNTAGEAQPFELAPTYVYLASDDSSNVSGQILHINGGTIVNG